MTATILLVDDEPHIIELAQIYIENEGFKVISAVDGNAGLELALGDPEPDLMVMDLMLPGIDGWELCKRIRTQSDLPIIMLTARDDDVDKIVGLELGADDYLTKPFNPRELIARIRAILRRMDRSTSATEVSTSAIDIENLHIDPDRRVVTVNGNAVDLRMKEFDLLLTLAQNPRIVLSREKLLNIVWGYDFVGETRTVDMHVAHLRHKLEGMTVNIETVWGVGYKLET